MVASGRRLPGRYSPDGVVLAVAVLCLPALHTAGVVAFHAPASHSYLVDGDLMIGAIFSMHKASWAGFSALSWILNVYALWVI